MHLMYVILQAAVSIFRKWAVCSQNYHVFILLMTERFSFFFFAFREEVSEILEFQKRAPNDLAVFGQIFGWALFPFMDKQYLLHLYQPSKSHYDLLRHAHIHNCNISLSTFVLLSDIYCAR